jgi:hypothetical protein
MHVPYLFYNRTSTTWTLQSNLSLMASFDCPCQCVYADTVGNRHANNKPDYSAWGSLTRRLTSNCTNWQRELLGINSHRVWTGRSTFWRFSRMLGWGGEEGGGSELISCPFTATGSARKGTYIYIQDVWFIRVKSYIYCFVNGNYFFSGKHRQCHVMGHEYKN